ncbi:bifunctional phosphopantothenoylcysteine decarboxylase/phosphopantothenate--cysteine ligase CoaBC [Butyrivibrio sp. DSM 10294]|uniref:bifunctional phosphopantothenoylcysteine decarboxylase/phosphopantothenate--cysteine ligase CoaBC n=1 Tax=Butyrivibrio sp. DSM 10294 TaxID=2972457 RepID=UPI00234FB1EC|nr:bifunctional phosphopantothenoylcysteine decarboxylase/phosphopantothenate--cysteine ligase CoaBC [Butyrivibrio sp. DSM 10294]MDC7294870.1 bifunctional phosphopantothenoylcysteine decarboxylase/phosphopantothenate--cysteine ligase CoaBC [Butyrivibrio sp. DSM 10294]
MLKGKHILLGISGGIAAYKAASLASSLVKQHADVHVVMTENATKLISPVVFDSLTGNKTSIDTFDRNYEHKVEHIALATLADLVIVAPATANVIAKFANGLADDMLTTTVLACRCPKICAPAMNTGMYDNPVTQDNIDKLRHYGWEIVEPADGYLACGTSGKGRMPEADQLLEVCLHALRHEHDMEGMKVLVTAGPTREAIDPVRFLTNHSTGKMGYEVAKAATARGAEVTLVSGPVELTPPPYMDVVNVMSARDMFEEVTSRAGEQDIIIKAAAVADYRPADVASDKIKKSGNDDDLTLQLERTDDILAYLGVHKKDGQILCGFSMETKDLLENSRKKLEKKNLDIIAANSLTTEGAGFGVNTNVLTLITKDGQEELPLMSKAEAADRLLDEILKLR